MINTNTAGLQSDASSIQAIRELSTDELDAVAGALQIGIDLGLAQVHLSVTSAGIAGSARAFGGGWHGATIFFEDLVRQSAK